MGKNESPDIRWKEKERDTRVKRLREVLGRSDFTR
jgi:hypothetical protein